MTNHFKLKSLYLPFSITLTALLLLSLQSFAQNMLQGEVRDEQGKGIPAAVMLLVNPQDSSIVGHAATDTAGLFRLTTDQQGEHWLQAHVMGYVTENKTVLLPHTAPLLFTLAVDQREIEAVRVGARHQGMKQKGDTIQYNVRAFTTGSEKTLGDVLARLPGVKVSSDGKVTAQGQNVEKILFNGVDLFGDNVALATKNVDANITDSVKVLHGYSEYSMLRGFENVDKTVIDVGVKEGFFNKLSGFIEAGGGYKNVWEGKANAMHLGTRSMVAVTAAANNTGESTFSFMDYIALLGGIQSDGSGRRRITLRMGKTMRMLIMPPEDTYEQRTGVASINYTYNRAKRIRAHSALLLTAGSNAAESWTARDYLAGPLADTRLETHQTSSGNMGAILGQAKVNYTPSEAFMLNYSINGDFNKSASENQSLEKYLGNESLLNERDTESPYAISQALDLTQQFGEHQLTLSVQHASRKQKPLFHLIADTLYYPYDLSAWPPPYNLRHEQNVTAHDLTGELSAKLRINEQQFFQLDAGIIHKRNDFRTGYLDGLSPTLRSQLTGHIGNAIDFRSNDLYLGVSWRKNRGLVQARIGGDVHYYRVAMHEQEKDPGQYKWFFSPDLMLRLEFDRLHRLTFFIQSNEKFYEVEDLAPGLMASSYRALKWSGGFNELMSWTPTARIRYFFNNVEKGISLLSQFNYSYQLDAIRSVTNMGLFSLSALYGGVWGHTGNANLMVSHRVSAFWNFTWGASGDLTDRDFMSNGIRIARRTAASSLSLDVESSYQTMFNFTGSISGNYQHVRTGRGLQTEHYGGRAMAGITFSRGPVDAAVRGGYHLSQLRVEAGRNIDLEAEINYNVWGPLKLSLIGRDLMNITNNQWATLDYTDNFRLERVFRQIPGHVLLKLRWEFGASKAKEDFTIHVGRGGGGGGGRGR